MFNHKCISKPCVFCIRFPFHRELDELETKVEEFHKQYHDIKNNLIIPHNQSIKLKDILTISYFPARHHTCTIGPQEAKTLPPRIELTTAYQQTFYIIFKTETDIEKMVKIIKQCWCSCDDDETLHPNHIEVLKNDDEVEQYLPSRY